MQTNKFFKTFISIVALCIMPILLFADNSPGQQLTQLLGELHSMQANFNQKIYDSTGGSIANSKGKVALQRPGKFRWDTVSPTKQSIIADGQRIWIYDPDLEQVSVQAMKKNLADSPAFLLTGSNDALMNSFNIREVKNKKRKGVWFRLTPKDKNAMFNWVELGFRNNQLFQMRLQDNLEQQTVINFSKVSYNSDIPSAKFNFKPPKGVDVIRDKNV